MLVLKDLVTMLLVGDGVIGAVAPDRHLRRWTGGRWPSSQASDAGTRRLLLRLAAVTEAGLALYVAVRLPAPAGDGGGPSR
jgi:hypothetical protein